MNVAREALVFLFMAAAASSAATKSPATAPSPPDQAQVSPLSPAQHDGPTTLPAEEVHALILQLGASDFHVRERAFQRLKEIGNPALPALKEAMSAADPEIQMRARELIDSIEHPPLPGPSGPVGHHFGRSVRVTIINGSKTMDVTEGDRVVHIEECPASLRMTVTGSLEGKNVTQEFKAANADDLKKKFPQAYSLYERFVNVGGGIVIKDIVIDQLPTTRPSK